MLHCEVVYIYIYIYSNIHIYIQTYIHINLNFIIRVQQEEVVRIIQHVDTWFEFILDIYIAPLKETYSEALPVQLHLNRNDLRDL